MRLLNVNTLQLKEFYGTNTPKYAILSHTWGDDEVTYSDIIATSFEPVPPEQFQASQSLYTNGSIYPFTPFQISPTTYYHEHRAHRRVSKTGYAKLEYTCKQAKLDGYEYVWIDTCCIDKSSSSELSEAINSMFRWYQDADICYAYLEDINPENYKTMLHRARWFTRGWTLQELLSPSKIKFYSAGFRYIASKKDLIEDISLITKIEKRALLEPRYFQKCSVAKRMSWAANRQTTREEDMAYSLLGIFGVNMPLLYGEGPNAFVRLQEEIMKNSDDQSLFAWNPREELAKELRTRSILASTPRDFVNAGSINPIPNKLATLPYNMTNQGLQIQLPLIPVNDDDLPDSDRFYVGVLNCQDDREFSKWFGITLMRTMNSNVLVGLVGPNLGLLRLTPAQVSHAQLQTVYILKDETKATLGVDSHICWVRSASAQEFGYKINSVIPRTLHWNEESQVLRTSSSGNGGFLFTSPRFNSEFTVLYTYDDDWKKCYFAIFCNGRRSISTKFSAGLEPKNISATLITRLKERHGGSNVPVILVVKVRKEEHLNQNVIVIDVGIEM